MREPDATSATYRAYTRSDYNDGVSRPSAEKVLVLTIVLGLAFALGMYVFIDSRIKAAKEAAEKDTRAQIQRMESRGPSALDKAAAVVTPFIAHVGAGRFAEAHALLAAPTRGAVTVAAFAQTCRASPILAAARGVTLNRLRQQSAGAATTFEASGVIDSGAGAVPIGFVLLQEPEGLRILVVSLANVPVLQGVTAR
jgi:hypothetical protein